LGTPALNNSNNLLNFLAFNIVLVQWEKIISKYRKERIEDEKQTIKNREK
jgi:hypothetical protein